MYSKVSKNETYIEGIQKRQKFCYLYKLHHSCFVIFVKLYIWYIFNLYIYIYTYIHIFYLFIFTYLCHLFIYVFIYYAQAKIVHSQRLRTINFQGPRMQYQRLRCAAVQCTPPVTNSYRDRHELMCIGRSRRKEDDESDV